MAIFHLSVKPVQRAAGRSATAAAAYRSAELVHDETSGETFDYTRKRGVDHAEIVLPTEAAQRDINWARDRQQLWNEAERAENRSNSRVAREYELALPHELTRAQRRELVQSFAQEIADRHGVAIDYAIHAPHRSGDERNHHAHLLATTRVVEPGGLGEKASIEWSDTNRRKAELGPAKEEIEFLRGRWAELQNEKFRELGLPFRVDHRSLEAQGIEREPTVHLGPAVSGMERRGIETEVGQRLDAQAMEAAQRRLEQAAELGKVERESQQLELSIVDTSGDLKRALQEREGQARGKPSIEELQRQGREEWLALRAKALEREKSQDKSLEPKSEPERDRAPARSIDEERREAAEQWKALRRQQELDRSQGIQREPEKTPDKSLEKGLERKGPELEID